ncbi:hypothetical protein CDEN61S_01520 [Castellaniella denitrificans]
MQCPFFATNAAGRGADAAPRLAPVQSWRNCSIFARGGGEPAATLGAGACGRPRRLKIRLSPPHVPNIGARRPLPFQGHTHAIRQTDDEIPAGARRCPEPRGAPRPSLHRKRPSAVGPAGQSGQRRVQPARPRGGGGAASAGRNWTARSRPCPRSRGPRATSRPAATCRPPWRALTRKPASAATPRSPANSTCWRWPTTRARSAAPCARPACSARRSKPPSRPCAAARP